MLIVNLRLKSRGKLMLLILLFVLMSSLLSFAIEEKEGTLINYDSINNAVQLNIEGTIYNSKLRDRR